MTQVPLKLPAWVKSRLSKEFSVGSSQHLTLDPCTPFLRAFSEMALQLWILPVSLWDISYPLQFKSVFLKGLKAIPLKCIHQEGWGLLPRLCEGGDSSFQWLPAVKQSCHNQHWHWPTLWFLTSLTLLGPSSPSSLLLPFLFKTPSYLCTDQSWLQFTPNRLPHCNNILLVKICPSHFN